MKLNRTGLCVSFAAVAAAAFQTAQASDEPVQASDEPATVTETEQDVETHLYLDVHELGPGNATAEGVADAHEADLREQGKFGVKFLRYWVDEENGRVYCLSTAPGPDAIIATHRAAHGLIPASVSEVTGGE